jgi:HAD domain in Swiss Army Knife RNA repair proteins
MLLVDIDGVVSLFGFSANALADRSLSGSFHWIDGIPHFLSSTAAAHLLALGEIFELVWCSGWEERADEYLPSLLGLPSGLPYLRFAPADDPGSASAASGVGGGRGRGGAQRTTRGHWKLDAIDAHAGARALAWIDDCLDEACHTWAAAREAPTLLVQTRADVGITAAHVEELVRWAPGARERG